MIRNRENSTDRPGSVLVWAVFLGLVAGTLELAVFLLKCHWLDPRNYNLERHFPWMFPLSGVLLLIGPGVVMASARWVWPRRVTPTVVLGILTFPGYLGLLFRGPILTGFCLVLATGLSFRTARFLARRVETFDRLARRGVVAMAVLMALTFGLSLGREAWASRQASKGSVGSKNVILIVLDTVRAESLSLYGYHRETTPNLVRLARRGVRFDQAFSTAPWTAPSHAGMFTGRAAHELSIDWDRPLDARDSTLAEVLGSRGYATAGFVANTTYCSYETGLCRGFDHYEDYDVTLRGVLLCSSLVQRGLNFAHKHPELLARLVGEASPGAGDRKDAARINHNFLDWLETRPEGRPFFAFLNYYDAHHPYLPPVEAAGPDFGRKPGSPDDYRVLKTWWEKDKRDVRASDVELAVDSYDRCLHYLDAQVGRLVDDLERRGVLQDSLVIITSDHGEHLGERRLFGHGCSVYRPELHVPLIVIDPSLTPDRRVVEQPVSLRDLPSTVMDRVGLKTTFPGRSWARCWSKAGSGSGKEDSDEPVLSEVASPPEDDPNRGRSPATRGPLISLVDRKHHYIKDAQGREELYDWISDPSEAENLARLPGSTETLERFRVMVPVK